MSKRISIYCSSSDILDEKYRRAARQFAEAASLYGYTVVCGGGARGLMGEVTNMMLEKGGDVRGVVPRFMEELELRHPRLDRLKIVGSMSKRKELLREGCDAVVAMPGGIGTLDELMETATLKKLGLFKGVVILFNVDGFYNRLIEFLDQLVEERFLDAGYRNDLKIVDSVETLFATIETEEGCATAFNHLPNNG